MKPNAITILAAAFTETLKILYLHHHIMDPIHMLDVVRIVILLIT